MKRFLRKHLEIALAVLAVIFVAAIIVAFTWGLNSVVGSVNGAVNANGSGGANTSFNLDAAKQLDLRGLVNQGQ